MLDGIININKPYDEVLRAAQFTERTSIRGALKKTNGIFSDIVQKGGRGSNSNHLVKSLRKK